MYILWNSISSELCKIGCKSWEKQNGHLPLWQSHMPWGLLSAFPLSLIFLFVLHTLAGSVLLNNTSSHIFENLTCSLLLLSLGDLGGPGTQHFLRLSAWDSDWLGWLFAMDSNFSKQGCPKGSKDGPHPPGAAPCGCPKKSVGKDPKLHKVSYLPCIPIWDRQTG